MFIRSREIIGLGKMYKIRETKDITIPELSIYRDYNENQLRRIYEPKEGIFIAETGLVLERALEAGYEPISLLLEEEMAQKDGRKLIEKCENAEIYTASREMLQSLTGYNLTRGVLCAMRRKVLQKCNELSAKAERIAILEDVMNPTNVGAIFRSAAAMGMDAVLLTKGCADPLYRRAIRVSMGNVFLLPWTYICGSTAEELKRLKEEGFFTAALALNEESISIADPILKRNEKVALVLGTEGSGLKQETIRACHAAVKIPMKEGVDSLNVAAASAVAFWEVGKRNLGGKI